MCSHILSPCVSSCGEPGKIYCMKAISEEANFKETLADIRVRNLRDTKLRFEMEW